MASFENSRLWQEGLAARAGDPHEEAREMLRAELRTFRRNAAVVAGEIAQHLPFFTVHDITHIDALWSLASEIAGPDVELTPTEAFVLGGAFLVHDLGMAAVSYPEGPAGIEKLPEWELALATILRRESGENPSPKDLESASEAARRDATAVVLRRRHASHAEQLSTEPIGLEGKHPRFLLEDTELRHAFGRVIGRVAHSHWWPVERLPKEFPTELNAPADFPPEWTIDPLKLACLMRTADACHLDRLRAPSLLRLLRDPPGIANDHWVFQGALDPPRRDGDRLRFTASRAFPPEDAEAWWLCLDALRQADRELQQVDSLNADLRRTRFAAQGVIGVDAPRRLTDLIPTDGWVPVEARIEVSDVAQIIERLGGAKLYGDQLAVPLRELIQNAADATELLAQLGGTAEPIRVVLREEGERKILEVVDYGVGMSPNVLTGPLLDFGVSLWSSEDLIDEFPGLTPASFTPTGTFGIGFFSAFMWSDDIKVISRRFDAALADTYVLELAQGPGGRPLLREAEPQERRTRPGTTVCLELREPLSDLANGRYLESPQTLCGRLAPALDVSLEVEVQPGEPARVVAGSDWVDIPGIELLTRLTGENFDPRTAAVARRIAENLRPLEAHDGSVAGRLALVPSEYGFRDAGALVVGGLRTTDLPGFAGILQGVEPTAARNEAVALASQEEIARWASEQAKLVASLIYGPYEGMFAANAVGQLGGDVGGLPICETAEGFLNCDELRRWAAEREEVLVVDLSYGDSEFYEFAGTAERFVPQDDVAILRVSGWTVPVFLQAPIDFEDPGSPVHSTGVVTLTEEAIARAWGLADGDRIYGEEEEAEERWLQQPERVVGTVEGREVLLQSYMHAKREW